MSVPGGVWFDVLIGAESGNGCEKVAVPVADEPLGTITGVGENGWMAPRFPDVDVLPFEALPPTDELCDRRAAVSASRLPVCGRPTISWKSRIDACTAAVMLPSMGPR